MLRPTLAVDTLRPEQLKPGMKGYGLSVFKGTKPERFEVDVVGVLKNVLPKQDMILIRMSGAGFTAGRSAARQSRRQRRPRQGAEEGIAIRCAKSYTRIGSRTKGKPAR